MIKMNLFFAQTLEFKAQNLKKKKQGKNKKRKKEKISPQKKIILDPMRDHSDKNRQRRQKKIFLECLITVQTMPNHI